MTAADAPGWRGRPLVVRCGAFGDMVLVTTLIRALAERWNSPVDVLTTGPWSEPLLAGQTGVGEVYCLRSRKTPYWLSRDQHRVVRRLRARGAGPTWYCDGNRAARPLLTRAGIDPAWIVDAAQHPLRPGEHATQQWLRLADVVPEAAARGSAAAAPADEPGVRQPSGGCRLEVSIAQRADLAAWLAARLPPSQSLIAIQVGNKRTMRRGFRRLAANTKYWPNERWAAVLRHLRERHPADAIVMLGAPAEYALNREIAALAGVPGVHNAADDLPVPRLVALLERARGLITVDSGPAHAGAAVGCPLVVLFGRASTSLYRPWGTGADVRVLTGSVQGEPSMLGIEAAAVTAAWDGLALRGA